MKNKEALKALSLNLEENTIYLGSDGNRYSFYIHADTGGINISSLDNGIYNPTLYWLNKTTFAKVGIWVTPEQLETYLRNNEDIVYLIEGQQHRFLNGIEMVRSDDCYPWRRAQVWQGVKGGQYYRYKLLDDHSNERKVSEIDD